MVPATVSMRTPRHVTHVEGETSFLSLTVRPNWAISCNNASYDARDAALVVNIINEWEAFFTHDVSDGVA